MCVPPPRDPSLRTPPALTPGQTPPRDALDRLRGLRVRPDRARSLGDDLRMQIGSIKKISHAESAAIDAWNTVVPDDVAPHCSASGMKAGKLVVEVPSAAARFMADRWLRSGGLVELKALARVPIRGIEFHTPPPAPGTGSGTGPGRL